MDWQAAKLVANAAAAKMTQVPRTAPYSQSLWLGGEDSNPQWQGQNLLCCRLHHPRRAPDELSRCRSPLRPVALTPTSRRKPMIRPTATSTVSLTKYGHARRPWIGEVRVGDTYGVQAQLVGHEGDALVVEGVGDQQHLDEVPRCLRKVAAAARDCQLSRPLTSRRMSDCGTPLPAR